MRTPSPHPSRLAWTCMSLFLIAAPTQAQTLFPTPHTFYNDVAYVTGGTSRQVMDIYTPTGASGTLPVVLYVHGGGWNSGLAEPNMDLWPGLGQGTFAIAAVNYRLNTVVEPLVTQVDDIKAAIRFIKANAATYNIDASRVGLMGQSAGAHLSGMAALTSNIARFGSASDLANTQNLSQSTQVQAVVSWALPPIPPSGNSTLSLATHISSGDPAFRMFHSTTDETVNISFARSFRDSMVAAGIGANLTEITGGHFPLESTRTANVSTIVSYFNTEFAAIPEPSAILITTFSLLLFGIRRLVRRPIAPTTGRLTPAVNLLQMRRPLHPLRSLSLVFILSQSLWGDTPTNLKPVSVGLGSFNYYSSGPFANTLLTGGGWMEFTTNWGNPVAFQNPDGTPNPQFDSRGLPRYLNPGSRLRLLVWPYDVNNGNGPARGNAGVGKWVVTWQGDADIRLNGATFLAAESSGAATGRLINGRRVYNMGATNPSGHITVEQINAASPVTDLKVWLPDPADPQNRSLEGQFWHPTFLSYLASLDLNHLRMMDWGHTNASPQQDWADRRLPDFCQQQGVLNRRNPAPGATAYTNAQGNAVPFAGDRETGIAYEYMVDLANRTGKDLWINVPHLATDDYILKLAQLIAFGSDGVNPYTTPQASPVYPPLDPSRKVWVEYSNEVWSNGNSFPQGNWAQAQATAAGLTREGFLARRYARIWQIFQQQFGGSARIVRVAGLFSGTSGYNSALLTELRDFGSTLTPPVAVDAVAPTVYFGNGIQDWVYEQANLNRASAPAAWFLTAQDFTANSVTRPVSVPLSDSYWNGPAFAQQQSATFVEWKRRIFSGSTAAGGGPDATGEGGGFPASLRTDVSAILGRDVPLVAYEGGPSLYTDYLDGGDARDDGITNFVIALNRRQEFAEIYRIQLNMARAKGLATHSMFVDVSLWSKYGQWGHLEYADQNPAQAVKWKAVSDWAADMSTIRPIDSPVGERPGFQTPAALPRGSSLEPYSQEIVVAGGNVAPGNRLRTVVIGSQLGQGLTLAPVAADPSRYRLSGIPVSEGWSYFYLRVNDDDGDAAWQVYRLFVAGGPGTLVESDVSGAFAGAASLPWTPTLSLDAKATFSGLNVGAPYVSNGGSATGSDGRGVQVFAGSEGLRFSVSQGTASGANSTLASAIADREYWQFTVAPKSGQSLSLRNAEFRLSWMREEYFAPRGVAVFTSVDGFGAGQEIYTLGSAPSVGSPTETTFRLPDTAAYQGLTGPVEFRIYFYGSQYSHRARILGLKLTSDLAYEPPTPVTFRSWRAGFAWDGRDPGVNADPNGDGVSNFLAYALDLSPLTPPRPGDLPQLSYDANTPGGPWLALSYRENAAASDLQYVVRGSTDLVRWTDLVPNGSTIIREIEHPNPDGDGSATRVRIRQRIAPSDSRRFLSLRAQSP